MKAGKIDIQGGNGPKPWVCVFFGKKTVTGRKLRCSNDCFLQANKAAGSP